jgi:serine/threonine-protein kinase
MSFSRIAQTSEPARADPPWPPLFSAAGLTIDDFELSSGGRPPLLPHDRHFTWTSRRPGLPPLISTATLSGAPVYFSVGSAAVPDIPRSGVLSTRRSAGGEAALWLAIIVIFTATVVMVRRNLHAGEGDLRGALILALVVVGGGLASTLLRAHHAPNPIEELVLVLSIIGWTLVWGIFSWLSYVAFEPHVRRLWPRTIVSWTRLLAGRLRDPQVGRDVLAGVLGGVALAGAAVAQVIADGHAPSDPRVALSLDALLTPGRLASYMIFAVVDALQYALGAFFLLLFLRLVLGRTGPAIVVLIAFSILLAEGAGLPYAIGGAALFFVVVLRVGLLSGATMLITQRLLTRIPMTLDPGAWYAGATTSVMLLIMGLALWGFIAATGRPQARVGNAHVV